MLISILPFIGVVADAIYLTIAKVFLRKFGRFSSREFSWFLFASIVVTLAIVVPLTHRWPTVDELHSTIWWLALSATLACAHNLLFYWGIEHESIAEVEPFLLFSPLGGILLASLFYPSERSVPIYIAIVVATLVLLWSHYHRHRVALSRGLLAIIAFMVISGLELVVIKQLLTTYAPLTLYLFRCTLILLGLTAIVRPRIHLFKLHHLPYLGLLAGLVVTSVWATYSSYQLRGISETLFVFTLSPILVFWLSATFLKERWQVRSILASIVIVALVIWVSLLK